MSFGGGFGGFGANNNTQSTGFGGFGATNTNNTSAGFGSSTNNAFGSNTGGGMFGGSNTSTFGSGGGFGANTNTNTTSTFGSKPFGSGATGGGLFGGGGGAASTGSTFGSGFGSANNTSSGFGANANTGGSTLFGQQNKPAFGASTTGTGGMFGGGGSTSGGFGAASNTTGGFGAAAGGFGAAGSNAPNNGTASTPFQAHTEKDGTSATQHYQTITFQQPYTNYSLEELRVADYNQGRRYGNQNGQGGAFGQNTGFGGFGANNTATNTTSGFGANTANTGGGLFGGGAANTTNTTGGFGSNTGGFGAANNNSAGGGLFGQAKPATGGLFGSSNTTQTGSSGGLFGGGAATNTNTTGGFGSTGSGFGAAANTGGGLFGGANNQAKSAFGASTTNTGSAFGGGSTGGFGQSNTGGGGLFGQNNQASATPSFGTNTASAGTGGGLFGNTGSSFGQNNQTQNQTQQSGGLFGGGGFGQNNQQNKPATGGLFGGGASTTNTGGGGLFGGGASTTNTGGGGLFGQSTQQPQQQQSGGLFGGGAQANNNTAGGGLFGAKPAATGGLFGAAPAANTGTSTGGLFGNLGGQNNQQKPGGLFGSSTTNTGGGSLFGGGQNNNNNQSTLGGSLFGNQSQQQQNQQPNSNSLFGASGGSALMTTSLNTNAYGNDALFQSLATPSQGPGPIATPLSSSQKNKKSAVLPQHKLNPAASTRLLTPQTKKSGGYGFSYSTYGSPSSNSASPNLGGSLFAGGQLSRSLGSRSTSVSNLRNSIAPETSILTPGAFSTTGRPFGNGSLKKLNVNRSINTRIPLFDEPSQKRVSFVGGDGDTLNGATNGETALVVREDDGDASPKSVNDDDAAAESFRSPQQVNGTELALVSEDSALTPKSPSSVNIQPGKDLVAGNYWSSPPLDQLKKMSKQELKSVANFVVGRHNIGQIEFNHGEPVDLSETTLDKLYGDIVVLNHRNATVYGENCTCLPKPALGTQLNRPSRIILGNSWPRNRAGKKDLKHLERLKRVAGTTFLSYNQANGEWTFTVPHFSSYGLDYDQDYSDNEDESSELSPIPDTPAQSQLRMSHVTSTPQQDSLVSPTESSPDDTFDFKRGMRARASVPGGFGNEVAYEESDDEEDMDYSRGESFLGERSVGSLDSQQGADYSDESESESVADQSMADSVSGPIHTTEQAAARELDPFRSTLKPKSILKASMIAKPGFGTPSKAQAVFDDDWANQLQRTVSPRKQDRQALRETQGNLQREHDANMPIFSQSTNGHHFTTAIDLMDSLFGQPEMQESPTAKRVGRGIELPYSKRPKTSNDLDQLNDPDKEFHNCNKPHFSENGVFIYGNKGSANLEGGLYPTAQEPLVGAANDIRFTKMPTFEESIPETLTLQKQHTKVVAPDGVPSAILLTDPAPIEFSQMAKAVAIDTAAGTREQHAWQLLSLLFDEPDNFPDDISDEHKERYRKEKLSDFWKSLVFNDAQKHAQQAASAEERAIAQLSCNNVADACHALLEGLNLRLATMVGQIGGDATMRQNMVTQIEEWRRLEVLSEMEDTHRALYELLSGNCAQSEGMSGAGRENKALTFNISSRFGLDWRRAFGLRLWYGLLADEPIELAIAQFADAIRDGVEDVKPVPWFVEQQVNMGWTDPEAANREDLLWGILKLYASSKMDIPANVEDVLAPENVSGHPQNARLSFQLFQLFKSRLDDDKEGDERKIGMPTFRDDGEGNFRSSFLSSTATVTNRDTQSQEPLVELGDNLALTYAASLHTPEHWTTAIWVYAHLSPAATREHYIRALLNQFASTYSLVDSDPIYTYLTKDLNVPTIWLHAAAALQAKTEGDAVRQASHLIKAEELDDAHEVLCRKVGPEAIISRDYDPLRELMAGFLPTPPGSPTTETASFASSARGGLRQRKAPVSGWSQGGQIYSDYIELLDLTGRRSTYRVDEEMDHEIQHLLSKLQKALENAAGDRLKSCALEERVALMEIAGTVANLVARNQNPNRSRILRLPLTEDLWLKHSCDLSANYYRSVMADDR